MYPPIHQSVVGVISLLPARLWLHISTYNNNSPVNDSKTIILSDGYWLALSLGPFSLLLPEYIKTKRGDVTPHRVVADSIASIVLYVLKTVQWPNGQ